MSPKAKGGRMALSLFLTEGAMSKRFEMKIKWSKVLRKERRGREIDEEIDVVVVEEKEEEFLDGE
jgi:hypothetical protein